MSDKLNRYSVAWAEPLPALITAWDNPAWSAAAIANIEHFRPEGSSHRPETSLRLLHNGRMLTGIFQVRDKFVRCIRTNYFDEVWKDSCVEIFLQPRPGGGYFNLEMNAAGAHLCCYIEDAERVAGGFKKFTKLPPETGGRILIQSSLGKVVEPELAEPVTWQVAFSIPLDVFEEYTGPLGPLSGQCWRGNFFKCAEEISHPHWASWSPVDEFNFHLPRCFGTISFQ